MKVGIKVYSNEGKIDYALRASEFVDFVEVMTVPDTDVSVFKRISKPIVIHAPHMSFSCNPADKSLMSHNVRCIRDAVKAADILGADKIILHPGHLVSGNCSVEHAIKAIGDNFDRRILLENLPQTRGETGSIFRSSSEIKSLLDATGCGLCLDFGHACASAAQLGVPHKPFLKQISDLKPRHFHICGGWVKNLMDSHLSLFDGDYPLDYFKKLMPRGAWVTMETPQDLETQKKEYRLMKR